jgi:predicted DNA-binding protein (MmcQ/YjbR family)
VAHSHGFGTFKTSGVSILAPPFFGPLPDWVSREAEQADVSDRTLERVRRLCLALPEARETVAWGHPVFKAGPKTFAAIEPVKGRPSIAFRLEPVDVDLLLKRPPFFVTPYGRGLWVSAWADAPLDWPLISSLVERSYRTVALRRMVKALDDDAPPARQASPATGQRHSQPPRRKRGKK